MSTIADNPAPKKGSQSTNFRAGGDQDQDLVSALREETRSMCTLTQEYAKQRVGSGAGLQPCEVELSCKAQCGASGEVRPVASPLISLGKLFPLLINKVVELKSYFPKGMQVNKGFKVNEA